MHVVNLIECIRGVVVALMFNSCAVRKYGFTFNLSINTCLM